ncbi:hypothetical protein [Aureispira sp. CCB-QB1]|uniref:hypothetical protein n=1 Tax=Aureispira sp. CCB-QB1 TaxID=1313421 RepID=UPI00069697DF|nr:hypothetical protein [Aureispira sp. CCB-QB1]
MDISEFGWVRKAQEVKEGDYWFDGKLLVTRGVQAKLSTLEVYLLVVNAMYLAHKQNGCDYLVVFINEKRNLKLFFIDQVTKTELANGDHPEEHHYATLMLASEY